MNSSPKVSCIVLNWNGWRDTIECLAALQQISYPQLSVIVVDNGSADESVKKIREAAPGILLLKSETNRGFAGGNNLGIRHALAHGAEYIWLLNNDTKPAPEALNELLRKAQSDSRIGAVASICYYADHPERVQIWAGGRINLWIGHAPYSTTPRDDKWFEWLNGTSLLLNSRALQDAGLLDESFFLYWEDTELGLRLTRKNWKLAAAPKSVVLHKVSASTGGNTTLLDRYATVSALRILSLYSPMPRLAMAIFLTVRFARRLLRFQFSRCKSVWQGLSDYANAPSSDPGVGEI